MIFVIVTSIVVSVALLLHRQISKCWRFVRGLVDLLGLLISLKMKARVCQRGRWSMLDDFKIAAKIYKDNIFLKLCDDSCSVTYGEADEISNSVGVIATEKLHLDYKDSIALFMPSCIDYVMLWLGLGKVGVISGLINNNLSGPPLAHAISTALKQTTQDKRFVIVGSSLKSRLDDPSVERALRREGITIIEYGEFNALMKKVRGKLPRKEFTDNTKWDDDLFFIYTSGTTGLPKASKINHLRFFSAGKMMASLSRINQSDVIYCALPLYHSAGGMVAISAAILTGSKLVIRPRFSVSNLMKDLKKHQCTVLQYIGDFARFALEGGVEREKTSLRVAFGNGLRPEVWSQFQNRFDIDNVIEFYGSTEGNANLVNNCCVAGPIGIVPRLLSFIYPVALVKCDRETGEIIRGADGLAVMAGINEPGQLLGLINKNDPSRRFDGYTNKAATDKKIARDIKIKGDCYFMSGDLLRSDWIGFFYWVDRIGDTFRWRGENVSTSEVEQVVSAALSVTDECICYGVEVPNNDGRAGMCKITASPSSGSNLDLDHLYRHVSKFLPKYSRPLFLRVSKAPASLQESDQMTATFKSKKSALRDQGYDPEKVGTDDIFFRDDSRGAFVHLQLRDFDEIRSGTRRL